ncbi:M50 family peptidase [Lachnospiraceae bacterium]|nr:M50 family peptidase [Lachnospiraceae bacterium]
MKKRINLCLAILLYIILAASLAYAVKKLSISFLRKEMFDILTIISFMLAYIFSILIHELSHFCAFWCSGIKVRILAMFGIVMIFNEKSIKISIYPKMCLKGGWVLPRTYTMEASEDYEKYKKNFCFSLIIAPIVSLAMMFILIIVAGLIPVGKTYKEFMFFYSFFAIVLNITSLFRLDNMWGDYYAFYKYKMDDFSFLYHVCRNYAIMRSNNDIPLGIYMVKKVKSALIENSADIREKYIDERIAYAINLAIMRYFIYQEKIEEEIEEIISFYIDIPEKIAIDEKAEEIKILLIHLIYYLKYNNDEKWKKLVVLCEDLFDDKEVNRYYALQIRQFCFQENNSEFLLDNSNIKTSSSWRIEQMLGVKQLEEKYLYQIFEQKNVCNILEAK